MSRLDRLEQIRRWRQIAIWAPVVWFPLVVYLLLMGGVIDAIGVGLAGICFAGLVRALVWGSTCPGCEKPFRATPGGFRRIWDHADCKACGLSLFELRRGRARSK